MEISLPSITIFRATESGRMRWMGENSTRGKFEKCTATTFWLEAPQGGLL